MAAPRTYKIGLYLTMHTLYKYMTRWQPKIEANLTSEQLACFNAVLSAISECLPLILPPPPTP